MKTSVKIDIKEISNGFIVSLEAVGFTMRNQVPETYVPKFNNARSIIETTLGKLEREINKDE